MSFQTQPTLKQLTQVFAQPGRVEWIGLRPAKRVPPVAVDYAVLDPASGIQGDHYSGRSGTRQVTLLQAEHLPAIAGIIGIELLDPALLRRNIVVARLNLLALKNQTFQLGSALLEYTGPCHPCTRMETTLGKGGYNAMRGHGGITARVIQAGEVRLGDTCMRFGPVVQD